ncbi:apolipoprotein A-V [Chlamydotis macqueenii]
MAVKAALLLALLAALPASPGGLARSGFWEHLSQLTSEKGSPERGQSGKPRSDMATSGQSGGAAGKRRRPVTGPAVSRRNLKAGGRHGAGYAGNLLEKLAPLSSGLQPRLYQDSDSLRKLIRKELESLRAKLSPRVDEAQQKVSERLEELRQRLQPLTDELLAQVSLKARELRRHLTPSREATAQLLEGAEEARSLTARYAAKIALHAERVKAVVRPYADRLLGEIHRNAEELHGHVAPHSQAGPQQLQRYVQELSAKLTRDAGDLHRKIQGSLEQLMAELSLYPRSLRRSPAPAEELAREAQRRVEEFGRQTRLRIRGFTRALDQEAEEMRLKLSSRPSAAGDPQDGPPAMEDLRARLDALWRDLARSLSERGGPAG